MTNCLMLSLLLGLQPIKLKIVVQIAIVIKIVLIYLYLYSLHFALFMVGNVGAKRSCVVCFLYLC